MEPSCFVLFPHGPPHTDAGQDACASLIETICGKSEKQFVGPYAADYLLNVAQVLVELVSTESRGVIVLTSFDDLALEVMQLRRVLTKAQPSMDRMLWMAFVELERHPFFMSGATRLGSLDTDLDEAPIWTTAMESQKYLVATPQTDGFRAKLRTRLLLQNVFARSTGNAQRLADGTIVEIPARRRSSMTLLAVSPPPPSGDFSEDTPIISTKKP